MIYENDNSTKGAMYVPVILRSDKITVSVMTGNVEYHPLYTMIGNIHGGARRAHRNGVIPIGFLAIPKGMSLLCHCVIVAHGFFAQRIESMMVMWHIVTSNTSFTTSPLPPSFVR